MRYLIVWKIENEYAVLNTTTKNNEWLFTESLIDVKEALLRVLWESFSKHISFEIPENMKKDWKKVIPLNEKEKQLLLSDSF